VQIKVQNMCQMTVIVEEKNKEGTWHTHVSGSWLNLTLFPNNTFKVGYAAFVNDSCDISEKERSGLVF